MIRRPPRSTLDRSSAASDVYKRQILHRLCRPPSISLSFNLATVLPRRHVYRVSFATKGVDSSHSKRAPFRARTTRVSNPVCSPSFRASVSGVVQGPAFATGVPLDIYAFHCYTCLLYTSDAADERSSVDLGGR